MSGMSINQTWALGFTTGFLIVIAVIIIVKSRRKNRQEFDERQMIARGKAYKYSFFSLMAYIIICMFLSLFEVNWAPVFIQFCLAIFIGGTVFTVICIFKDAYMGYNYKRNIYTYAIGCAALGIMYIANFVFWTHDILFTNGMLNENSLFLFSGIMFLTIGVSLFIKKAIDRKASENE